MPETFDVKLIRQNSINVNEPDDKSYPFVLDVVCRPPSFMEVTFTVIYGGSEIVRVRGKTLEAIVGFTRVNDLARHPRLRSLTISEEVPGDQKSIILYSVVPGDSIPAELQQQPGKTGA